ncbi:hypothetical protein VSR69_42320 [Paraburkholderia phytofirmans]
MRDERKLEVLAKLVGQGADFDPVGSHADTFTLMSVVDIVAEVVMRGGQQCVKARIAGGSDKGPISVIAAFRDEYAAQRRAVFEAAFLVAVGKI